MVIAEHFKWVICRQYVFYTHIQLHFVAHRVIKLALNFGYSDGLNKIWAHEFLNGDGIKKETLNWIHKLIFLYLYTLLKFSIKFLLQLRWHKSSQTFLIVQSRNLLFIEKYFYSHRTFITKITKACRITLV